MLRYADKILGGCSSVVEHELPKLGVEGSIPFTRSIIWSIILPLIRQVKAIDLEVGSPTFSNFAYIGNSMTVTIWHNPRCSKSRQTLALLEEKGINPTVRLYLEDGPSVSEITDALKLLDIGAMALMRKGEAEFKEQGLKDVANEAALIQAMADTPKLIERPIVFNDGKAKVGRPPESVLEIL